MYVSVDNKVTKIQNPVVWPTLKLAFASIFYSKCRTAAKILCVVFFNAFASYTFNWIKILLNVLVDNTNILKRN